ncbi:hypothetical protein WR25_16157 [Diploscapter pachys]|uniref:EF-hand domain-containing protein n=1 Tax=Diploscapter pachys TaxID=2018661 RepID=A0A2A2JPB3_9BILA|nr:hypothetical protein WR25_16157 [Diploscapter pachys]
MSARGLLSSLLTARATALHSAGPEAEKIRNNREKEKNSVRLTFLTIMALAFSCTSLRFSAICLSMSSVLCSCTASLYSLSLTLQRDTSANSVPATTCYRMSQQNDRKDVILKDASAAIGQVIKEQWPPNHPGKAKMQMDEFLEGINSQFGKIKLQDETALMLSDLVERATRRVLEVTFDEKFLISQSQIEAFLSLVKKCSVDRLGVQIVKQADLRNILKNSTPPIKEAFTNDITHFLRKTSSHFGFISVVELERYIFAYSSSMLRYSELIRQSEDLVRISADTFRNYLLDKIYACQLHSKYDKEIEWFACYVERFVFFLLGGQQTFQVTIKSLLLSGLLEEFNICLQQLANPDPDIEINCIVPFWDKFTVALDTFKNVNSDSCGLLSLDEMIGYYCAQFSEHFLRRIFATQKTFENGRLDFQGFVEFLVATEFRKSKSSMRYIFECLNLDGDGFLKDSDLQVAAKSVLPLARDIPQIEVDVLTGEIFDMVHPVHPEKISLEDLDKCKLADWITGLLVDATVLEKYENRENEL